MVSLARASSNVNIDVITPAELLASVKGTSA
jgi:hypothetical protein